MANSYTQYFRDKLASYMREQEQKMLDDPGDAMREIERIKQEVTAEVLGSTKYGGGNWNKAFSDDAADALLYAANNGPTRVGITATEVAKYTSSLTKVERGGRDASFANNVVAANANVLTVEKLVETMKSLPPVSVYGGAGSPQIGQCYVRPDGGAAVWVGDHWIDLTAKSFNAIRRDFPDKIVEPGPAPEPVDPAFPRKLDIE